MIDTGKPWYDGNPKALPGTLDALEMALTVPRSLDGMYLRDYFMCPADAQQDAVDLVLGFPEAVARSSAARQRFSLLRSVIDSYCAMVCSVPSIDVTTTAGTYSQRRSAELLGGFDDGVLAANDMEALCWQCTVDSCLTRVGGVVVEEDGGRAIRVTRVLPHHVVYNPLEGMHPRNLAIRVPTSLSEVCEAFPKQAMELRKSARPYRPDPLFIGIDGYQHEISGDLVLLDTAWHLCDPGNPDSGRRVRAVGDIILGDSEEGDPWPHEWMPFVPLRFDHSYASFAGVPAADTLQSYQAQLDEYAATIRDAYRIGCKVRIFVDKESGISKAQLNDVNGQVIDHNAGKAPVFDRGSGLPPEYLQREQVIIERAHEFMGMNYQIARGVKADGIASAKGQREVIQLAQNRQVLRMRNVQNWIVRIAETINRVADNAYSQEKGGRDIEVKAPGSRYLRRIRWSEIDFDKDQFTVRCDAINALSRHPAARVDEVLELVQAKIIDERQGLKAIGVKDLQHVRDQAFAAEDYAERLIDLALRGDYRTPDPYAGQRGLQLIIDRGQERYLSESAEDEPSEYLGLLRDLIEAARATIAELQKPPANDQGGAAPAAPPPPPAGAAPPPDLGVPGSGLPALPPGAAPSPVAGQGIAV